MKSRRHRAIARAKHKRLCARKRKIKTTAQIVAVAFIQIAEALNKLITPFAESISQIEKQIDEFLIKKKG